MKKNIFIILFFGSFAQIFGCRCVEESIARRYLNADIVALVTIEKTYADKEDDSIGTGLRSYSADLKFEKIYKGIAFKTLNVFGNTTSLSSGACEKLVAKGEKYMILLSKNKDGLYYVSSCSTMPQISDDNFVIEYENIFKILEKNMAHLAFPRFATYHDLSEDYNPQTKQKISGFLKLNRRLRNKIGIYKVKVNDDEKIIEIVPIQKIGIKEKQVQELMKKNLTVFGGAGFKIDEYLILLEI